MVCGGRDREITLAPHKIFQKSNQASQEPGLNLNYLLCKFIYFLFFKIQFKKFIYFLFFKIQFKLKFSLPIAEMTQSNTEYRSGNILQIPIIKCKEQK